MITERELDILKKSMLLINSFKDNVHNINSGKEFISIHNRNIETIEKDSLDKVIGDIYLIGKLKNEKIISFQLGVYNEHLKRLMAPGYSLPKDFVFPKWEGREPFEFPELDYWQEK